ncbi:hypothetical protein KL933_005300 [Ogataea haglerorum]|uniref:RNA helicase n=1 Tax=Ogataea haglerorum TaxID=1937702 RepID=A0AAN6HY80_9ASCO|nr:hypothetical protein KL915_005290 [Ogataea haglerorum]KAG7702224.1 hypothetical protein KL914_005355 [Ogataea haglerorum]KAG7702258.1 hypothetical protein KL950_005308 [Ogataea haglerorum]KAG7723825.1 hypothetical protein KL933_005300 [Ogataea haglerorum]KAG7724437.1 hypothetical protein KL948_005280 [Ogataea haglerorum]
MGLFSAGLILHIARIVPFISAGRNFQTTVTGSLPFNYRELSQRKWNKHDSTKNPLIIGLPFGAFISIRSDEKPKDGLCHISQISTRRLESPSEILKTGQEVFVKVIKVQNDGKISLSMRNIDQSKGAEVLETGTVEPRAQKRKQDPDLWELTQMNSAFGVKKIALMGNGGDDPYAEVEEAREQESEEEEVEIEVSKRVPSFLKGKNLRLDVNESDLTGTKNPEGSMTKVAQYGSKFMSEAKMRKLEQKYEEDRAKRLEEKIRMNGDPLNQMSRSSENEIKDSAYKEWQRQSRNQSYGIRSSMTIKEQRESLPVYQKRDALLQLVQQNDFLIVVGETGSGKTTQITQYLAEEGYSTKGVIACTQPRRVAATSVAKRVAQEVGCRVGEEVGYTIRFEDCTSNKTIIKYMTDGMLQREVLVDPDLTKYSVIMLDEAHERTIATDVLFALLREAVIRRKGGLKLIVTSATLDSQKFSKYFENCPVFHIEGRTFPVKIFYTKEPELDYIQSTIETVIDVHTNNPPGDILVFLTGKEEIDTCCETLVEKMSLLRAEKPTVSELIVLPIYSSLPSEMQSRIFEPTPPGKRKVVLATNIAETSVTIDGIYYVIDPGYVKVNAYDPKLGMDTLIVQPISRAQADQRSGRAGRTGPGICYRLYTKNAYLNEMPANTVPEIQRQNLSYTILMLKAMGIDDVLGFNFMDRPKEQLILTALEELYILDALDENGVLTDFGQRMAFFPMEPLLSKTLIQSIEFKCSDEVITIIAMLSVPDVFYRPKEKRDEADRIKAKFHDYNGDHLTLLNVYNKWSDAENQRLWCQNNFVHEKSMRRAREVRRQLLKIFDNLDKRGRHTESSVISCRGNWDLIRKAFVSGYFKNSAKRAATHDPEEGSYRTLVENTPVHIHPSSSLFRKHGVDYVIYHTLVLTNKEYMHCITKIDPKWLVMYAPRFFRTADPSQLSTKKKTEKLQPLFNRNDPKETWRLSKGRR